MKNAEVDELEVPEGICGLMPRLAYDPVPRSMVTPPDRPELLVRAAGAEDADAVGRLLHDFNREFDEPTPEPAWLAERIRRLLAGGETMVLLGGRGPDGVAVLRFRPAIWSDALECYLAELYVIPTRRGHGLGRALMEAAMQLARDQGADHLDLNTAESDVAARGLYSSLGFSNREGKSAGPVNYYYEREL
jgi:ribosomal protein S18 acetylase RimI-like enzyme